MHQGTHKLKRIINNFAGQKILVVGDLMLDRYLWGRVDRISPEAPVPVVEVMSESSRPGGAANVAANLAALGAKPLVFGVVGDDKAGEEIRSHLESRGVDPTPVVTLSERITTMKTRIMAHGTQVARVDREERGVLSRAINDEIQEGLKANLSDAGAVVVSDYGKGVVGSSLMRFLARQARRGLWVGVDPKDPTLELYRGASLVTPNQTEAGAAFGRPLADESLLMKAGRALLDRLGLRALLITRGDQGLSLFEAGGTFTHFPTVAVEVYDVTGAGDTVVATLMLALAAGAELAEAAMLANHAAGAAVREVGTAAVTTEELISSLEE